MLRWSQWRKMLRPLRFARLAQVHVVRGWLGAQAKLIERENATVKFNRWQAWAVNQTSTTGASLVHKFIRGPTPWM